MLQSDAPSITVRRFHMTLTPLAPYCHTIAAVQSDRIAIQSYTNKNSWSYSHTILPYSNTFAVLLSYEKALEGYYNHTKCVQQSYMPCHTVRLRDLGTILHGLFSPYYALTLRSSPVNLFWVLLFLIAMAKAFLVPTRTTNFFARVRPV